MKVGMGLVVKKGSVLKDMIMMLASLLYFAKKYGK